jgi:hypothetical protein
MLRRDFLKAFSAFGAALAAGVRMPSGPEVEQAPPVQPPALETPTPACTAKSAQDMVMERLKECDVISSERISLVSGHDRWKVTYRYIEGKTPSATNLNSAVEPLVAGKRPVAITVSSHVDSIDITHLGQPRLWREPETAVMEIEVIWA